MKRLTLLASCLFTASTALAQTASMQSPAYQECTALATSNPEQALAKADTWLKIDNGVAAQHCRAMALFGLHRFAEAGDALATARDSIAPESITLRSYIARQAAQSYLNASSADKALAVLTTQINEMATIRSDNATAAKETASLLLERARLNITYGKLGAASKDLDHAVSLTPINEEVLIERAGVFEKLGDIPLARNDLDAVLTINPNNNVAKNFKKRLNGKAAPAADIAAPAPAAPVVAAPAVASAPTTVDTAVAPVAQGALAAPAAAATAPALPFTAPPEAAPTAPAAKKPVSVKAPAPVVSKPALPVPGASVAP